MAGSAARSRGTLVLAQGKARALPQTGPSNRERWRIGGNKCRCRPLKRQVNPDPDPERPDHEWAGRAQAGDRNAFTVLVQRHQHALHRYLSRMTGTPDEAMELAQEVFVRAWQALPQWQPDAPFRAWLFRIASNAALDLLRRRRTVRQRRALLPPMCRVASGSARARGASCLCSCTKRAQFLRRQYLI